MKVAASSPLRVRGSDPFPFEVVARLALDKLHRYLRDNGLRAVERPRMFISRVEPALEDLLLYPSRVFVEVDTESVRSSPPTDGPSNRAGIPLSQASSQGEPPA